MNKSILIAGGAGFLGSHLCERLLDQGHDIFCVDNFSTGSRRNISSLINNPNFQVLDHDVSSSFSAQIRAEQIYNLACPASPVHYQRDPIQTTKTSVYGAINLLEIARENNARILQASTSEVYGDPDVHPQIEAYLGRVNPIGVRACYDEGKRCAESIFFDHHRMFGTEIKVLRIFNTYGPRMLPNDGRVVSNFIVQALRGQDLTIFGDGTQTRSFCYVDDLIDCFISMMNSDSKTLGPINAGNPNEFTILELAEKVLSLVGGVSKLVFKPLPSDDPRQRKPDISFAKQKLDWEPKITLIDGLRETIKFFRKTLL